MSIAELLKESVFKLTDMETRFGLNMNVLDAQAGGGRTPMVMGLKELLADTGPRAQIEISCNAARSIGLIRLPSGWSWSKATSRPSSILTG